MKKVSPNIIKIISKYCNNQYFYFKIHLFEKNLDKINWTFLSKNKNISYTFLER